ncbi:MAG: translation initiation factor IF-1 [Patescibacteria group bacterium]
MDSKNANSSSPRGEGQIVSGVVQEALPNTHFKVQVGDSIVLSYLSGKMRLHRIRVLVGDKVEILLDPYGGKGRIIKRG